MARVEVFQDTKHLFTSCLISKDLLLCFGQVAQEVLHIVVHVWQVHLAHLAQERVEIILPCWSEIGEISKIAVASSYRLDHMLMILPLPSRITKTLLLVSWDHLLQNQALNKRSQDEKIHP